MVPTDAEMPSWEEVVRCASYDDLKGILPHEIFVSSDRYNHVTYRKKAAEITLTRGREMLGQLETEIRVEESRWEPISKENLSRLLGQRTSPRQTRPSRGSLADTPPVALDGPKPPKVTEKYWCLRVVCDALVDMAQSGKFDGQVIGNYFQGVYDGLTSR